MNEETQVAGIIMPGADDEIAALTDDTPGDRDGLKSDEPVLGLIPCL
jgi:hypothetical protein